MPRPAPRVALLAVGGGTLDLTANLLFAAGSALWAVDAKTGAEIYGRQRIDPTAGGFTASPWAANGRLYVLNEEGDTYVTLTDILGAEDAFGEPAIYSSRWIEDGSFVRLQNVTLGYVVPLDRVFSQVGLTRVYVSGDNLWMNTDYTGYDPESHTDAGLASRGIDYLKYPNPRTFTLGVRVGL